MILVARPAPQLPRTLRALREKGFAAVLPFAVSEIEALDVIIPVDTKLLVFTSANAVHGGFPKLPCACIGPTTAAAAREAGFEVILTGTDDAHALAAKLATVPLQSLCHLHGNRADLGWHKTLRDGGHAIHAVCAYNTHYAPELPTAIATAFREQRITHSLLFSAGGAKHLRELLERATIAPCGKIIALSQKTAAASPPLPTQTPPHPTLQSLISLLPKNVRA